VSLKNDRLLNKERGGRRQPFLANSEGSRTVFSVWISVTPHDAQAPHILRGDFGRPSVERRFVNNEIGSALQQGLELHIQELMDANPKQLVQEFYSLGDGAMGYLITMAGVRNCKPVEYHAMR
jgi:hypothetical protein